MSYDNQFVILDRDLIVDPALAIFVSIVRVFDEGDEGVWKIKILHDPNITSDLRARISQLASTDISDIQPFGKIGFSNEYYSFFEFSLVKKTEGRTLVWHLHGIDEKFPRINFYSSIARKAYQCSNAKAFLLYVFKNLLLMPELRTWGKPKYDVAQIVISGPRFAYLTDMNAEQYLDPVILDERKVVVLQ